MKLSINLTTIKRLLSAIKPVKKDWWINFGMQIFDYMQGIIEPLLAAWIISSIVAHDER
jgi:hypothetical protein